MKKHILVLALICGVFLGSCDEGKKKEATDENTPPSRGIPERKTKLDLGIVHENLAFDADPGLSYSLYLPRTMKGKQDYPVLYCIDPKGMGHIPLYLYRNLADSFEVILVGCNTSKNGMTFPESEKALNLLVAEIQRKYPVEQNIHLLGFSGGAKVAFHYADINPNVNKLLYSGAVYPLKRQTNISLLGFVGKRDMNFADLVSFEVSMGKAPFTHQLIQWDGKHEFPSEEVMRDGFYFLKNDSVQNYHKKIPHVAQEDVMREQMIKRKFYQSFGTKDLGWWKTEIAELNKFAKNEVMFERVLGFIGLSCYSFTQQAIQAGDVAKADYMVQIYLMATPDNEDAKRFAEQIREMKQAQ